MAATITRVTSPRLLALVFTNLYASGVQIYLHISPLFSRCWFGFILLHFSYPLKQQKSVLSPIWRSRRG